ncbi:MAG TPA: 16S rRNA (guanine(966)-N(2))-methyltransferase RsmD [Burkholderiaceae bacterium]|nr:16S rRNA (guanine(966)-N(2))-methyltransferase RsmD [Burkholderiaceae bacterium]
MPRPPAARSAVRPAAPVRGAPPARVRIVGGTWKRTPLPVLDLPGLRPTPDRVRETLFNWLGRDLDGWTALDLYAGTGALGLEAASRGAARVVLVERERRAVESLRATCAKLKAAQVEVVQADAAAWLAGRRERFDLVLLDPPFGGRELARVLPALGPVLAPGAAVYVETDAPLDPASLPLAACPGLVLHRADKAGQVHYHLLLSDPG